jgi:hypothetical protein
MLCDSPLKWNQEAGRDMLPCPFQKTAEEQSRLFLDSLGGTPRSAGPSITQSAAGLPVSFFFFFFSSQVRFIHRYSYYVIRHGKDFHIKLVQKTSYQAVYECVCVGRKLDNIKLFVCII